MNANIDQRGHVRERGVTHVQVHRAAELNKRMKGKLVRPSSSATISSALKFGNGSSSSHQGCRPKAQTRVHGRDCVPHRRCGEKQQGMPEEVHARTRDTATAAMFQRTLV
jgi:hypothetical protein